MPPCDSPAVQAVRNLAEEYGRQAEIVERVAGEPKLSGLVRSVMLTVSSYLMALRWALEECADGRTAGPLDELASLTDGWLNGRQVTATEPATVGDVARELLQLADDGNPHHAED